MYVATTILSNLQNFLVRPMSTQELISTRLQSNFITDCARMHCIRPLLPFAKTGSSTGIRRNARRDMEAWSFDG